jgi:CHASE2 domain-containing sensor protein
MAFRNRTAKQWKHLCGRGWWYWLRVFFLIALGIYLGHKLEERELWTEVRYSAYQWLDGLSPNPPSPDNTALVLIGDDEYWSSELDGREPIRRDYIARLVETLDSDANPAVIALDFDLRSPSPEGNPVESEKYWGERKRLCEAIKNVSQRRKIVLPKAINYKLEEDAYYTESDIYNKAGDADADCDLKGGKLSVGYIAFPDDLRQVPLARLPMKNGDPVDSFSQAIARAFRPRVVERLESLQHGDELPFGGYIKPDVFKANQVSAKDVLGKNRSALEKLDGKLVIVSGQWHSRSYNRGPLVDSFTTPVGALAGALVHANYVEAMLGKRLYRPWAGSARLGLELFWSIMVALPFALDIRPWQKFLAVTLICVGILFFSYVSLVNVGLFYDFFIPTLLVIAHGTFEQVCEWRAAARKCERLHGERRDGPPPSAPPVSATTTQPGAATLASCLLLALALSQAAFAFSGAFTSSARPDAIALYAPPHNSCET